MTLINHNISNPNDGLGDQLRTAFGNQNLMNSELYTETGKLRTDLIAAATGASGKSIVPTSPAPTGTGIQSYTATQAGTYTNYGGVVVNANSFAIISRDASGAFSISQTPLDISGKVNVTDVVNTLTSSEINKPGSANNDRLLNEKFVDYAKTNDLSNFVKAVAGKNLYDKTKATDGKYMSTLGVVADNPTYSYSDHIPVIASTIYKPNDEIYTVVYFDSSKNYLSGANPASSALFTTPVNTAFVVVTFNGLAKKETFQLEKSSVSTAYEAYSFLIPAKFLETKKTIDDLNTTIPVTGKGVYDFVKSEDGIAFLNGIVLKNLDLSLFPYSADASGYYGNKKDAFNDGSLKAARIEIYSLIAGDVSIRYYKLVGTTATLMDTQAATLVAGQNKITINKTNLGFATTPNDLIYWGVKPATADGMLQYKTGSGFDSFKITDALVYTAFATIELSCRIVSESDNVINSVKLSDLVVNKDKILESIGSLTVTGANIQSLVNANDFLRLPATTIEISTPIIVPSGKRIEGVRGKTNIKLIGGCLNAFLINNANNIDISNLTITGTNTAVYNISGVDKIASANDVKILKGMGTEKGIIISGASYDINLSNLNLHNLTHSGVYAEQNSGDLPLYTGVYKGVNLKAYNCYTGLYFSESAEYCEITNSESQNCIFGLVTFTGNLFLSNSSFVLNRVGFYGGDGVNDSHSSISNCNFNHNKMYSLFMLNTEKGWFFSNCEIFESPVYIENVIGFNWNGGRFGGELILINGGINMISNALWGVNTVTKSGVTDLKINNCYSLAGTLIV